MLKLQQWQLFNLKCETKCLFKLGDRDGFFSEYNNMLVAIQWCMVHKVRFILTSKWANFGFSKGWSDYFLPFCDEWNFPLEKRYFNDRISYKLLSNENERHKAIILHFFLEWWYKLRCKILHIDYFTHHLFSIFRLQPINKVFRIEELDCEGTIPHICTEINRIIWHYNEATQSALNERMPFHEMKEPYVSVHIRRGDKYTEMDNVDIENYISVLSSKTDIRRCFVATDDYSVFETLVSQYPEWSFFTIAKKEDSGFDINKYNGQSAEETKNDMYELFTTIEIMSRSKYFVGTMGSNIGMHMYFRMPQGCCFGVDYSDWRIF